MHSLYSLSNQSCTVVAQTNIKYQNVKLQGSNTKLQNVSASLGLVQAQNCQCVGMTELTVYQF